MEEVIDNSDGSLVSGSLARMLRRSKPGLVKRLMLRAYVGGVNCKLNLLFEGAGHFECDPSIPKLQSIAWGA